MTEDTTTLISYLISGRTEAELPDGNTAMISEGNVIGEVSYCLQCPASASVTAMESCMCLRWNQKALRALYQKNKNIKRTLDTVLSSHMARKLSETMDDRETPAVDPV